MVQGINSNPTAAQLFSNNQASATSGQYQNISGPNDVADKTTATVLNTEKTLGKGLVNALNQTISGINNSQQQLQQGAQGAAGTSNGGNGQQQQYNQNGQVTVGVNQSGNLLNKII